MKMTNGNLMMTVDCLKTGNSVKNAVSSMNRIASKAGWTTKVVSVMSPDQVNWPGDFTSDWRAEFEKVGRQALTKFLKKNHAVPVPASRVLFQPYHSKKGSVQTILTEIDSSRPAAVAVFTHTAKTSRGMPAGFVSSIIAKAGAPVFVVNAKAPPLKNLKTIVFATDFSNIDSQAFDDALDFAAKVGGQVIVVYVIPNLVNELMTSYAGIAGGWNGYANFLESQESEAHESGDKWVARAKSRGVTARYELLRNSSSIASGILKAAKKHSASLIVMTEKTGPWEAVFIGSVTRDVLEKATSPVLVIPAASKESQGQS
jgi:nucleotide-binding universal stress UspA family protein